MTAVDQLCADAAEEVRVAVVPVRNQRMAEDDDPHRGPPMRIVIFCHSLVSDWNHGNAHFLRGVCAELVDRGHDLRVYEPIDGWSRANLVAEHGSGAVDDVLRAF